MSTSTPPGSGGAQPGRIYGKASISRAAPAGSTPAESGPPDNPAARISGRASIPAARPVSPARSGGGGGGGSFGGGGVYGGGRYQPRPERTKARPRWGRIALVALVAIAMIGGCVAVGGYLYARNLNSDLSRTDPFSAITGGRPAKQVQGSLNILMLGSDSRDPDSKVGDDNGPSRTDTIMVMHIPASHDKAYLVSIPRDTYVYVPKSPTSDLGDTKAKINASFAWGGVPLMIQTVEGFTGLRMDHVVIIDFSGFKEVTDALGGVDMNVERDIKSIHTPFRQFKKGVNHFNGEEALDYVRQRYQFPDGDFARVRHQQEFLKALMDKAASTGTVSNPAKLNNFLKSATKAITVDKDFSLINMALQFRSLRSENLAFLTSPVAGTDTINGESVVLSDKAKATEMYEAMAKDTMDDWVAANPKATPKPAG